MASDGSSSIGNEFIQVMETFPCLFNVGLMKKPNHHRLSLMIKSVKVDISLDEDEYEGQKIEELNMLSWLCFQVGDLEEAKSKNDDALCLDTDHLVTLGNRAFLEWYSGTDLAIFLEHLEKLKLEADFPERRLHAKGLQAKLLFRLGGVYNMSLCVPIYDGLVKERPDNFEWKYVMSLARRRLMVMVRNNQDEMEIEQLYRDIAEKATQSYFKSSAMCELAVMLASRSDSRHNSTNEVDNLVERILALFQGRPKVYRQCGIALTKQFNLKGIDLLRKALSLRASTVTQHSLAKCLVNPRYTRNMNREECDREAAQLFQASYDSSFQENVRPLVDLGFFHMTRNRFNESLEIFTGLVQNWMVKEVYTSPFNLSKITENLCKSLKRVGGRRAHPHYFRYVSIATSFAVEQFKRNASPSKQSEVFDLIANPGRSRMCRDRSIKYLLDLISDCVGDHSAVQILMRLKLQGKLGDQQHIENEVKLLIEKGEPGEALLLLDMAELQENHSDFSQKLRVQAMLQEAKWQLSQGLVSCKLLFHKLFKLRHSSSLSPEEKEFKDEDDTASPETDVLIFHDGHHWKPFLQDNRDQCSSDKTPLGFINQNRMIEDVVTVLYDLETITNPWLTFSGGNQPDTNEFSDLLRRLKVRLVLVVVDPETSKEFLQMVDHLLSKTCEANETDSAIVYTESAVEASAKSQMPKLASMVRSFKADEQGLQHSRDSKSVTGLVGTEMLDAYFCGNAENAIEFFKFLAPCE